MVHHDLQLPLGLQVIARRLDFGVQRAATFGRFQTFYANLTDWRFSLTDENPCIWVNADDAKGMTTVELLDHLRDTVRAHRWYNNITLVFMDGDGGELRVQTHQMLPKFVVVDAAAQSRLHSADSPTIAMRDILLDQMPLSQIAPYETNRPVVGSRFFGRSTDINRVLNHPARSYLFVGIRRIGKTSLLKELEQQLNRRDPTRDEEVRRHYIDCSVINTEQEFLEEMAAGVAKRELKTIMRRAQMSRRQQDLLFTRFADINGGPVTFLVDELDRLLLKLRPDAQLFDVMRAAATDQRARFIMAGFRQSMDAAKNMHSAFFNFTEERRLRRFARRDIDEMLQPLQRLNVTIEDRNAVVNRIFHETTGLPNYVQYYCRMLVDMLEEEGRTKLCEQDIGNIHINREFRNFVLESFTMNTTSTEKAIVFALVAEGDATMRQRPYTMHYVDAMLQKRDLRLTMTQLETACRNLDVAGIMREVGKGYEFAIPLFIQMLRETKDVDFLFRKTREEILNV